MVLKKALRVALPGQKLDPFLIFFGFLGLYALSLIQVHTYDALNYAAAVQTGTRDLFGLLQPHHLVYNVAGRVFFRLWELAGWRGGSLLPLQVLNAFISSFSLALFYRLLAGLTRRPVALVATALLAVTHGYWLYTVEVEVYLLSAAFLIATFYALTRPVTHVYRQGLVAGALLGLAVLAHQSNLLFGLVALAAALSLQLDRGQKARLLLSLGAAAFLTAFIPYAAAILVLKLDSPRAILFWLTTYVQMGSWGKLQANAPLQALGGIWNTLAVSNQEFPLFGSLFVVLLVGLVSWAAWQANRRISGLCLVWIAAYGLFFTWWEPSNLEFWIAILPPVFTLLALSANRLTGPARSWALLGLAALVPLLAGYNWSAGISLLRDPAADARRQNALDITRCMAPGEKVLLASPLLAPWLNYFGKVETLPVESAFLVADREQATDVPQQAFAQLQQAIDASLGANRRIFAAGEALESTALIQRYGVSTSQVQSFFDGYSLRRTKCVYLASYLPGFPSFAVYLIRPKK